MSLLVKICGLKTPEALDVALSAGADMVGFVFFEPSPRHITMPAARMLGERVKGKARKVALSVNADDEMLAAIIEALKPDLLQLHGQETPDRVVIVRARFGIPVMKALPISAREDLSPIHLYSKVAEWLLFDARAPREATRPGGLGKAFDWRLLRKSRSCRAVHALRRARCRQRRRGVARHARARGRCVFGRRARPRRQGPGQNPRFRARGPRRRVAAWQNEKHRMTVQQPNSFRTGPDERGHFGIYGGRFVAETLMPVILELEQAYAEAKADPAFQREMDAHLKNYVGRPSPLYFAERLTALRPLAGAKIYFKREDLNHTGAHKVNNVLGQIMLARRMGKPRVIAETGAGMHGVATATMCAKFGLECVVFMGAVDVARQQPNVLRMQALGAEVRPVESGAKDA